MQEGGVQNNKPLRDAVHEPEQQSFACEHLAAIGRQLMQVAGVPSLVDRQNPEQQSWGRSGLHVAATGMQLTQRAGLVPSLGQSPEQQCCGWSGWQGEELSRQRTQTGGFPLVLGGQIPEQHLPGELELQAMPSALQVGGFVVPLFSTFLHFGDSESAYFTHTSLMLDPQ